ncbi:MAG: hypothetical protein U0441_32230 [Polyangiaceae bacterium]
MSDAPSGPGASRRGAALVFALALAARLAVVAWAAGRIPPVADGTFYHTIAGRIANGLGYTWLWPDGAVTYAGHYPVGYPALVGAAYAVLGPYPPAAMLVNALLGALAAVAAYALAGRAGGRRVAGIAGVLVALHPGLLAYTPAMMTEGVTAALVTCAAWAALGRADRSAEPGARPRAERSPMAGAVVRSERSLIARAVVRAVIAGLVVGVATLVRPQSLVLAPIVGWLATWTIDAASARRAAMRRIAIAAVATIAALAVCAPWTARNCVRMKRCALVSYNGGWNLLIGADDAATGTWSEIKVPPECREVFDEAEKDVCFGAAARRYIAEHPSKWLALAPKKLAATFDYAGAGGWYLHAANPAAFSDGAKTASGAIETVFERVALILALLAAAREPWRRRRAWADRATLAVIAIGLIFSPILNVWIAYAALAAALSAAAFRSWPGPRALLPGSAAAVIASLLVTHAVFFGAGRYSLVAFPLVTAAAALAFAPRSKEPAEAGNDATSARGAE